MVKITMRPRSHHHIVPLFGCRNTAFSSPPAHHSGIRSKPPFEYLIPSDDFSAFGIDIFLHSGNEIALQFVFVFQIFTSNNTLTMFTGLPSGFRGLITSNVNIFARKKCYNFIQNVFQKLKSLFFRAKNIVKNTPTSLYFKRPSGARQLRIRSQSRYRMTRHLNFRNNRDVPLSGIGHHLFDVFLSEITSVANVVIFLVDILPYHRAVSISTNLCEFRIFFDFNPPPLIIRKMPMKRDRKSTRLNSSHVRISYAVFCLKKKNTD